MYLLFFLLLPSVVLSRRLSVRENEELKANCGAHYLGMVGKSFGTPVEKNTYPWIAALSVSTSERPYGCSAVQISSRHILTAAHCVLDTINDEEIDRICAEVEPEDRGPEFFSLFIKAKLPPESFTVYASSSCNDDPYNCKNVRTIFKTSKTPRVHEGFDPCTVMNDLALIELDQDISSTVGSPICMIEKDEHLAKELAVLGHGYDPNHPTPENSIFNRLEMMKIDSVDVKEWKMKKKLEASLKEKMICGGDSGGPLVQLDQKGKYSVIGISSSSGPLDCSMPVPHGSRRSSDFIDLRHYTDWICTHTGICSIKEKALERDYLSPLF